LRNPANKQTNKQTNYNADENNQNITSLAEV